VRVSYEFESGTNSSIFWTEAELFRAVESDCYIFPRISGFRVRHTTEVSVNLWHRPQNPCMTNFA